MKTGMFEGDGFITLNADEEKTLLAAEVLKTKISEAARDLNKKGALYIYVRRPTSIHDATDCSYTFSTYDFNRKE